VALSLSAMPPKTHAKVDQNKHENVNRRTNTAAQLKIESIQGVQTSAKDFYVLFLAVYRNQNSKGRIF